MSWVGRRPPEADHLVAAVSQQDGSKIPAYKALSAGD